MILYLVMKGAKMTCKSLIDPVTGLLVGWACGSAWGMGVTTLHGEEAEEFGGSIYGFGVDGTDPHDFWPDEENSPAEMAAWEKAKAECPNKHE